MNDLLRRILFLPEQASTFSTEVDQLHFIIILITIAVAIGVGLAAVYFALKFRRRSEDEDPVDWEPPLWTEWVLIAVTTVCFLSFFAISYPQFIRNSIPPGDAIDVYVTGKKWMWEFAYPGGRRTMAVVYVPRGRPVRLMMRSRDVIHSFFVPAFRIKQDVLPARYSSAWFTPTRTGTFEILCAEYCGTLHSGMRGQVVVLEPAQFEQWLASGAGAPGNLATDEGDPAYRVAGDPVLEGHRVANRLGCLQCHSTDGRPHIGPSWRGLYGSRRQLTDGTSVRVDDAYLTESMMDPRLRIAQGFQPVMPSYQGLLQDGEAAAIVQYIRSLSGVE